MQKVLESVVESTCDIWETLSVEQIWHIEDSVIFLHKNKPFFLSTTQPRFTYSNSAMEKPAECLKSVQS